MLIEQRDVYDNIFRGKSLSMPFSFSAAAQYGESTQKFCVIGADFIQFSAQQDKIFAALESSNSK